MNRLVIVVGIVLGMACAALALQTQQSSQDRDQLSARLASILKEQDNLKAEAHRAQLKIAELQSRLQAAEAAKPAATLVLPDPEEEVEEPTEFTGEAQSPSPAENKPAMEGDPKLASAEALRLRNAAEVARAAGRRGRVSIDGVAANLGLNDYETSRIKELRVKQESLVTQMYMRDGESQEDYEARLKKIAGKSPSSKEYILFREELMKNYIANGGYAKAEEIRMEIHQEVKNLLGEDRGGALLKSYDFRNPAGLAGGSWLGRVR
ncbi:MAG: hypothetical protein AB7F75_07225 [Planctomycetota bacterium]